MTVKKAIDILYHEATNEERKYSLEEIEKAKETLCKTEKCSEKTINVFKRKGW
ncbi:MAG: hypothetical protein J6T10_23065 [Methanobrevibacter sp.]|nr:hypothetical protein [Methanobrevibacter sp.]